MKQALADVSARGVWTDEQRRSLKAAFSALGEALDDALLLVGKRVSVDGTVSSGTLELTADCPFKPKTVQVLNVTGEDWAVGNFPLTWSWSATPTSGSVTFADTFAIFAALGDGTYTFDLFLEKD